MSFAIHQDFTKEDVKRALSSIDDSIKAKSLYSIGDRGYTEDGSYMEDVINSLDANSSNEVKLGVLHAVRGYGVGGAPYHKEVMQLCHDQDKDVRYQACLTLAGMGVPAAPAAQDVARLLDDKVDAVRCGACSALGAFQSSEHKGRLEKMLEDKSPEVQGSACLALGKIGSLSADTVALVAKRLQEPRSCLQAVVALGSLGAEASKHAKDLCDCLTSEDMETRMAAAVSVGSMKEAVTGAPANFNKVTDLLKHKDGRFRIAAIMAIGNLGEKADSQAGALNELLNDTFEEPALNALTAGGARVRSPPITRKIRCTAAVALGALGQKGADYANAVSNMLADDDWEARVSACDALAMMKEGASNHASEVAQLLKDEKFAVRAKAAYALGCLGDVAEAESLAAVLKDTSPTVRQFALEALGKMGEAADAHIEQVFEKMLDQTAVVRMTAINTLGKMGEKGQFYAGAIVQRALDNENPAVAATALEVLGKMEERGAAYVEEVSEALKDPLAIMRNGAVKSLGNMGEAARPYASQLRQLAASDPVEAVRISAKEACEKIG